MTSSFTQIEKNFNPRSPCGERPVNSEDFPLRRIFQSTLPVWGATLEDYVTQRFEEFQSTLPVWGATHAQQKTSQSQNISIHAPRVGSDVIRNTLQIVHRDFNPRSPCGERPVAIIVPSFLIAISIHAPRVGSDWIPRDKAKSWVDFNPRSPCGERRPSTNQGWQNSNFNPRSPCGERPLLTGGRSSPGNFNPRSPCGERLR